MRDALAKMGADPKKANPLIPVDLVIDHSVQVDQYGTKDAFRRERPPLSFNATRSAMPFFPLGQSAFLNSERCRPIRASCTR